MTDWLQHLLYSCVQKENFWVCCSYHLFLWVTKTHTSPALITPYISTPYASKTSRISSSGLQHTQPSVSVLPSGAVSACTSLQSTSVLWNQLHHPWWCQACEWCHAVGIQVWGKHQHRELSQYNTHATHSCCPICPSWLVQSESTQRVQNKNEIKNDDWAYRHLSFHSFICYPKNRV